MIFSDCTTEATLAGCFLITISWKSLVCSKNWKKKVACFDVAITNQFLKIASINFWFINRAVYFSSRLLKQKLLRFYGNYSVLYRVDHATRGVTIRGLRHIKMESFGTREWSSVMSRIALVFARLLFYCVCCVYCLAGREIDGCRPNKIISGNINFRTVLPLNLFNNY